MIAHWLLGVPLPPPLDVVLTPEQLRVYEGTYRLGQGLDVTVTIEDDQLFAQGTGQEKFRLRAQGEHRFVADFDDLTRIQFFVEGNRATRFTLDQGGLQQEASRVR